MSILFVSGWVRGKGIGGLSRYNFDPETGKLEFLEKILDDVSFGASVFDEENGILYVLGNNPQNVGLKVPSGGSIYEIHYDKESGEQTEIRNIPIYISNPCNIAIDKSGNYFMVVGHGSRNYVSKIVLGDDGEFHPAVECDDVPVLLIERKPDGSVGKILDVVKHTGSGPLPKQQTAHPHCVAVSPLGNFFIVCDKGNDSVFSYTIDTENGKLKRNGDPVVTGTAVCPRYAAFHPEKRFVYHNSETSTDMYTYSYTEDGLISLIGVTKGTQFAPGEEKDTEGQGLNVHPSGRFIYNVTNGTNTVDVFAVNEDGGLTLIQSAAVDFAWPRGQLITPDGRFLILSCSVGGKILVYSIGEDGTLTLTDNTADLENAESMSLWTR